MNEKNSYDSLYKEIKIIGKGSFGTATLIQNINDNTYLVSKKIHLNNLDEKAKKHALLEVDILKTLHHPNIVGYKDSFLIDNKKDLIIIMEYCEEGDLDFHINQKKKNNESFPEKLILNWIVELILALDYIHDKKIHHRDIKCSNVFLTSNNTVKLGDFGISKVLENSNEIAMTFVGTPYFMSPEICQNKPYNFKSDVWALGCVIYELCCLKHVFDSKNILTLITKIIKEEPDPIPSFYSSDLENLLKKILVKDYIQRPTIKKIFSEDIIQKTMKEFAETKGNNIKQFTLTQKAQKKTDLVVSKDEELSKPHFQMGNTILSEDFNEFSIQGKSKVNKNTSHESQKNVLSQNVNISLQDKKNFNYTFDKTVQSLNYSYSDHDTKESFKKPSFETVYEEIPIIEQSNNDFSKESGFMDTHFTISAGMPHRKMMKQLAEIHREKEKKIKNDDTKEFQEYPNDFEEEQEENPHNYNIFEALEGRKKKNFLDLIKLCENQLQTVHSHEIKDNFSANSSQSPSKNSFKVKKSNYIPNIAERNEKFKANMINKIGKTSFNLIYNDIRSLLDSNILEEEIYEHCLDKFDFSEEIYFNIKRLIDLEGGINIKELII